MSWFDEGGTGSPVDVQQILGATEVEASLWQIIQNGAMVSLGTTSDGGAMMVQVTMDGRWRKQYFRDMEECSVWLAEAATAVAAEARSATPPKNKGRSRRS